MTNPPTAGSGSSTTRRCHRRLYKGTRIAKHRPQVQSRRAAKNRESPKTPRPNAGLPVHVETAFEENRVTQECQKRTEIRQGIQPIRRLARKRLRKPSLQQRTGGRQHEVRQPDTHGQQQQNSADRIDTFMGLPAFIGHHAQQHQRHQNDCKMYQRLAFWTKPVLREMSVRITGEQHRLKEQHARGPHGGTAAEPRQNIFAHQGLHLEQQKSADEDCRRIIKRQPTASRHLRHSPQLP